MPIPGPSPPLLLPEIMTTSGHTSYRTRAASSSMLVAALLMLLMLPGSSAVDCDIGSYTSNTTIAFEGEQKPCTLCPSGKTTSNGTSEASCVDGLSPFAAYGLGGKLPAQSCDEYCTTATQASQGKAVCNVARQDLVNSIAAVELAMDAAGQPGQCTNYHSVNSGQAAISPYISGDPGTSRTMFGI